MQKEVIQKQGHKIGFDDQYDNLDMFKRLTVHPGCGAVQKIQ